MQTTRTVLTIVMTVMLCAAGAANAGITGTYVDATTDNTGPSAAIIALDYASDNKWDTQPNSYETGVFGTYEIRSFNTRYAPPQNEDCPMLTTTVSGLASGDYDIYLVYRTWNYPGYYGWGKIQGAISGQTLVEYDETSGTDTGYDPWPGYEYIRQVKLGTLYGITSFSVDVDDTPAVNGDTTYSGVAYDLLPAVPEPSALLALGMGLAGLAGFTVRKRK